MELIFTTRDTYLNVKDGLIASGIKKATKARRHKGSPRGIIVKKILVSWCLGGKDFPLPFWQKNDKDKGCKIEAKVVSLQSKRKKCSLRGFSIKTRIETPVSYGLLLSRELSLRGSSIKTRIETIS